MTTTRRLAALSYAEDPGTRAGREWIRRRTMLTIGWILANPLLAGPGRIAPGLHLTRDRGLDGVGGGSRAWFGRRSIDTRRRVLRRRTMSNRTSTCATGRIVSRRGSCPRLLHCRTRSERGSLIDTTGGVTVGRAYRRPRYRRPAARMPTALRGRSRPQRGYESRLRAWSTSTGRPGRGSATNGSCITARPF